MLLLSADFFQIEFLEKFFQEYNHEQRVKRFGSRSGPTFCRFYSGSKLFAEVISTRQKSPLARTELSTSAQCELFKSTSASDHKKKWKLYHLANTKNLFS